MAISVMGLFCEDIREEKNDILTLVGLVPDNANVAGGDEPIPAGKTKVIPKLCVYVRINYDPKNPCGSAAVRLIMPDGSKHPLGDIDAALMETGRAQALARGNLLAGVTFRAVMSPLPVKSGGHLKVEVEIGSETHLAAALNLNFVSNAATASAPPSVQ
ncbi:MAG TPA: hypothetical protein VLC74_11005 [Rhizomicrobium sp.]|nr:hypothetical protein [Rhizomicrobium sp.]